MKNMREVFGLASIVTAIGLTATPASASGGVAGPLTVTWFGQNAAGHELAIQLASGPVYYADIGSAPCGSAPSADDVKIWASEAQGAFLSGSRLSISYLTCSDGNNYIQWINLSS